MVFFNAECKMKDTGWAKGPDKIRAVKLKKVLPSVACFFKICTAAKGNVKY